MYCFTYANSFDCVLNELSFWADISGEHVVFVKDLAYSNKVNLSRELVSALSDIGAAFSALNETVREMRSLRAYMPCQFIIELRVLADKLMFHNRHAVETYNKIMELKEGGRMFQIFLNHTIREQQFMHQAICNIKMQISRYPEKGPCNKKTVLQVS